MRIGYSEVIVNRRQFLEAAAILGASSALLLVGCSSNNETGTAPSEQANSAQEEDEAPDQSAEDNTDLTEEQRNSVNMLNYLAVVTQEICASQNSKLLLEQIYTELYNNTEPSSVNSRTLSAIESIMSQLANLRMVAVKRERLQYIYEKACADAITQAVPSPVGLLSTVQAFNPITLVASVVYMAVDSASSYTSAMSEVEERFLEDGWALDDEATASLDYLRQDMFTFMVNMSQDYNLPSGMTLSEEQVSSFVEWQNESNNIRHIQYLEDNNGTFHSFGPYWLALADAYFENENWEECLDAIEHYEDLDVKTFREDHDYAQVLPLAISAIASSEPDDFIEKVERYVQGIIDNTGYDDWLLRYFAATSYISLYSRTNDVNWLERAYDLVIGNVNNLVGRQKALNAAYLAPVQNAETPSGATKEDKEEIKAYNSMLEQERKVELPPVDRPLLTNLALLAALCDVLEVSDEELTRIRGILFGDDQRLFLVENLNSRYSFDMDGNDNLADVVIAFDGKQLSIPVRCVCDASSIELVISDENSTSLDDWKIDKVERGTEGELDTYIATYRSRRAEGITYHEGIEVTVSIDSFPGQDIPVIEQRFEAVNTKDVFYEYLMVWEPSIGFVEI